MRPPESGCGNQSLSELSQPGGMSELRSRSVELPIPQASRRVLLEMCGDRDKAPDLPSPTPRSLATRVTQSQHSDSAHRPPARACNAVRRLSVARPDRLPDGQSLDQQHLHGSVDWQELRVAKAVRGDPCAIMRD